MMIYRFVCVKVWSVIWYYGNVILGVICCSNVFLGKKKFDKFLKELFNYLLSSDYSGFMVLVLVLY